MKINRSACWQRHKRSRLHYQGRNWISYLKSKSGVVWTPGWLRVQSLRRVRCQTFRHPAGRSISRSNRTERANLFHGSQPSSLGKPWEIRGFFGVKPPGTSVLRSVVNHPRFVDFGIIKRVLGNKVTRRDEERFGVEYNINLGTTNARKLGQRWKAGKEECVSE